MSHHNNMTDNCITTVNLLPPGSFPLEHQVAGHFSAESKKKLCILQTNDGLVLKPVQSKFNGKREVHFLQHIFCTNHDELDEYELNLRKFLPLFRGLSFYSNVTYIKMDDLAYDIDKPCVMDLKIGRIMYDPLASQEKINRQKQKYPKSECLGFQISGMRIPDMQNQFVHYDKSFGRNKCEDEIVHCIGMFYQFHRKQQLNALNETICKLESIYNWFKKQRLYHFYSSSILVIYESNLEDICINFNDYMIPADFVRVSMIDFTHVCPANEQIDENYLFGLEKLIKILKYLNDPNYIFKHINS